MTAVTALAAAVLVCALVCALVAAIQCAADLPAAVRRRRDERAQVRVQDWARFVDGLRRAGGGR